MQDHKPLCVSGFLLTTGVTTGVSLGTIVLASLFGRGQMLVAILGDLLPGISMSWAGFFVAIVWGFFLGGIVGAFFVWLYNKML